MSVHSKPRYASAPARQLGQAFLLVVLLLVVGIGALIFNLATPGKLDIERDKITADALAQAKGALIGRAAGDLIRPGGLPCPDIDNDGDAESPVAYGGVCPSYIGRFPWKTLGVPEPRDGSGERLWYALTASFRDHPSGGPLNSDSLGQLTITGTTPANNVIAIVFAPGPVVASQVRDAANQNNVANYLEGENANGGTTYTTAPASNTFNDKLLAITGPALMPVVEQRVAREMISILRSYRTATGVYPWADSDNDGRSDDGSNRGRFPCDRARPTDWGDGGTQNLPNWLTNGCDSTPPGWAAVIYYAAASNRLASGCTSCTATSLSVDGAPNVDLVLLTPGAASASPRGAWPSAYFEDGQNNDNANDSYVTPASTAYNRDRLFKIP